MDNTKKILIAAGAVALLLLLPGIINAATMTTMQEAIAAAEQLIPQFEGFLSTPKWDEKQWSWGYGTAAPGPGGTITREQAAADMGGHIINDYNRLAQRITRPLLINQWAALLSFAYNEGTGNPGAGALVADINAGDDRVLEPHWKKYIYAGGVVNSDLVDRRNKEWDIWMS